MRTRPFCSDWAKVIVQLPDVAGIGAESLARADAALGLDERIEGGQVDRAAGTIRRRILFDDFVGC